MAIDRRDFLKTAGAGVGLSLAGISPLRGEPPPARLTPVRRRGDQAPDFVIVGAGAFGMWTALNLVRLGATVTVVDEYGPGNSRSTSGGETRGVRTSYGDRPHGLQWGYWADEAIRRWLQWDEEGKDLLLPRVFFQTGDLIMREEMEPYLEDTLTIWNTVGIEHEQFGPDEIRHRWPWINAEGITVALYETNAGVVRARRAIESVATRFRQEGGEIRIARAALGGQTGRTLNDLALVPGESMSGSTFIFALGPWFPKFFPKLMGNRLRIPMGYVFYFQAQDTKWMYPNMPSYGVPGCTGWPALPTDDRGFRVRTGGKAAEDPDTSDRLPDLEAQDRPRQIIERYFPELIGAPINETRACHYELGPTRNFLIDRHPDFDNVWLTGSGCAEAFKQGPVLGEYIAKRVLGIEDPPDLAASFALPDEFEEGEGGFGRRRPDPFDGIP